jgi:hypothetical protein
MALRRLYNLYMASGNPSYLTGLQAGGAATQVSGTTPNPMIGTPRRETEEQEVLDVTASGTTVQPAVQGALLVQDLTVQSLNKASQGGGAWRQSATANARIPRGKYGIVMIPGYNDPDFAAATATSGTSSGLKAQVVLDGPCMALAVTTNTATIVPGSLLTADGAGHLRLAPSGTLNSGEVLAVSAGTLPWSTSTATLIPVDVGGY